MKNNIKNSEPKKQLCGMRFVADFDRPVDPDKHYLSPGGYSVELRDGRKIEFDFFEYCGDRIGTNSVAFEVSELDTTSFPDSENLTVDSMVGCNFDEFFVFTGEYDDPEIYMTNVHDVVFTYDGGDRLIDIPFSGEIKNLGQSREIPEEEKELF